MAISIVREASREASRAHDAESAKRERLVHLFTFLEKYHIHEIRHGISVPPDLMARLILEELEYCDQEMSA